MFTVRRVYLYLVAAVSLISVSWAVIGLARLILGEGIGQGQIIGYKLIRRNPPGNNAISGPESAFAS